MDNMNHEFWMNRALDIAQISLGNVSPNPMVGALLVKNGELIAENYHQKIGEGHAEALLIQDVVQKHGESEAQNLFKDSVLYVTLEPCSHFGRTPPCAELLVKWKIPTVVVAMLDPNEKVNGNGVKLLRENGIEVITGICEERARFLNRRFLIQHQYKRPYIILKWAETADGFFAPENGEKKWITGKEAKVLSHKWRSEEDAILVGKNTAIADKPYLNVREWQGRNPKRIVLDKNLEIPKDSPLFLPNADVFVFNEKKTDIEGHIKFIEVEQFDFYLPQKIVYQLYLWDIQSVIIEGGAKILNLFLEAGLFDEVRILKSNEAWGSGIKAPYVHLKADFKYKVGKDLFLFFHNQNYL